jgi:2,3-bisphosphoglycerate-independent phosphoglycerate mutase
MSFSGIGMKTIVVLLDGLGDRSCRQLDYQTPLQAAETPHLDHLAALGSNGLYHAANIGQCLPSEIAHYLMFGYDLEKFPGRGLLEAVGYGLSFEDRDVLSLAHLAGVERGEEGPVLIHGRNEIRGDRGDIDRLYDALSPYETENIRFELHRTRTNDAVLILKGQVSPFISDSDPMVVGRPMARVWPVVGNTEPGEAARTARALNKYLAHCHRVLDGHEVNVLRRAGNLPPANFLATLRAGRRIAQEPFQRRWGVSAMMIASGAVFEGLAHELGMTFVRVRDGEDPGEDLRERLRIALSDRTHAFIHVHTKVPDEAAHTGNPHRKRLAISALDRGLNELLEAVATTEDLLVAVTADHSTPTVSALIHSGEPIPLCLAGSTVRRDRVDAFDEVSCSVGSLGLLRGKEFILTLLNHADRASLMGQRLGKTETPYVPESYDVFEDPGQG